MIIPLVNPRPSKTRSAKKKQGKSKTKTGGTTMVRRRKRKVVRRRENARGTARRALAPLTRRANPKSYRAGKLRTVKKKSAARKRTGRKSRIYTTANKNLYSPRRVRVYVSRKKGSKGKLYAKRSKGRVVGKYAGMRINPSRKRRYARRRNPALTFQTIFSRQKLMSAVSLGGGIVAGYMAMPIVAQAIPATQKASMDKYLGAVHVVIGLVLSSFVKNPLIKNTGMTIAGTGVYDLIAKNTPLGLTPLPRTASWLQKDSTPVGAPVGARVGASYGVAARPTSKVAGRTPLGASYMPLGASYQSSSNTVGLGSVYSEMGCY